MYFKYITFLLEKSLFNTLCVSFYFLWLLVWRRYISIIYWFPKNSLRNKGFKRNGKVPRMFFINVLHETINTNKESLFVRASFFIFCMIVVLMVKPAQCDGDKISKCNHMKTNSKLDNVHQTSKWMVFTQWFSEVQMIVFLSGVHLVDTNISKKCLLCGPRVKASIISACWGFD